MLARAVAPSRTKRLTEYAGLTFTGPRCNELQCAMNEYCSPSERCESCSSICDYGHHNFDEETCVKYCQNYIHDTRYERLNSNHSNLRATVENLEGQVHTLTLLCGILIATVLVLLLAALYFRCFRCKWITDKFNKKKIDCVTEYTHENPHTESPVTHHRSVKIQAKSSSNQNASNCPNSTGRTPQSGNPNTPVKSPRASTPISSKTDTNMAFTITNNTSVPPQQRTYSESTHDDSEYLDYPGLQQKTQDGSVKENRDTGSNVNEVTSQRSKHVNVEIPLDVRNLNRLTSSHYTIPDTPETQSTRVDEIYLGSNGTRLPSEDSVLELNHNNTNSEFVRYNSPASSNVIYSSNVLAQASS